MAGETCRNGLQFAFLTISFSLFSDHTLFALNLQIIVSTPLQFAICNLQIIKECVQCHHFLAQEETRKNFQEMKIDKRGSGSTFFSKRTEIGETHCKIAEKLRLVD